MHRKLIFTIMGVFAILLVGCATPQKPLPFSQTSVPTGNGMIGVIQTKIPDFSVNFPGADCLLCIGLAKAAHYNLISYSESLKTDELISFQDDVVKKLNAKGFKAKKLSEQLEFKTLNSIPRSDRKEDYSEWDFKSFAKDNIQVLLVINYKQIGFRRGYQSYFPTEVPKANIIVEGYMVNLADNKLIWYKEFSMLKGTVGDWDVSPKYPELTNQYFSLIEDFKDSFLGSFN